MKLESISVAGRNLLAFALVLGLAVAIPRVEAQTFSVVHNFTNGSDGGTPLAGFMMDAKGRMYGTSSAGGSTGAGVVFRMNRNGTETVLHNFAGGKDGAVPESSLVMDAAGSLYGTTMSGGTSNVGTVYRLNPNGAESVLYSFAGNPDGANPIAGLAMDLAGNLYGTTTAGGASGNGTVFELIRPKTAHGQWSEKVLYSFGTGNDGTIPVAGVTLDANRNLYGTTSAGGQYGHGTVFELRAKSGWKETILYSFQMQNDGGTPYAGLIFDSSHHLYGATTSGGSQGGGTVFELTPSGGSWNFTVLYGIAGWNLSGSMRDLVQDAHGNIYGTTHCDGNNSRGTVYELVHSKGTWTYSELYTFTGGSDGLNLFSNLVRDAQGTLYGTASEGGANGDGVVFKVTRK